jgi:predicted nucleic acid-binding Zn ribbon protein
MHRRGDFSTTAQDRSRPVWVQGNAFENKKTFGSIAMSSSHRPQRLGEVLGALIETLGIEHRLDDARIVDTWREIAGAPIGAVMGRVWVHKGILYVTITSAPWRQELYLHRNEWRRRLNDQLGTPLVQEIVFR